MNILSRDGEKLCKCGCGEPVPSNLMYVGGHNKPKRPEQKNCACGCGIPVPIADGRGKTRKLLEGHRNVKTPREKKIKPLPVAGPITETCQCGCGQQFSYIHKSGPVRRFIKSHRPTYETDRKRLKAEKERRYLDRISKQKQTQISMSLCPCGCGSLVQEKNGKPQYVKGHAKSSLWREKISASMKNKYKDHGYKQRVARAVAAAHPKARPGKPVEFDGITYRSTWEAARAAQLKTAGIPFEYEAHQLPYTAADGITHHYIPDFWLPTLGRFEEVKGFFREKDKVKMSRAVAQNLGVTVVVIELLQEWRWIERGEAPDVNAVRVVEGWMKIF